MRNFVKHFSALLFGAVLFVAGCVGEGPRESHADMGNLKDGQLFTLKSSTGGEGSLSDELRQNKAVLLNFWATWCPPCREEIPGLISIQEKFGGQSFTILGVDVGESEKKVSSFAKKMNINYPLLLDTSQSVSESYGVVGIPTSILISSDGKILGEYHAYTQKLVSDIEKALK